MENKFIKVKGKFIQNVKFFNYLGVVFSENLMVNSDIKRLTGNLILQPNAIYYRFNF